MINTLLSNLKSYLYLFPLLFGIFIAADDQTVIVTILPELLMDMKVGINELDKASWTITGYLIGYTAILPLMGNISDKIGWKSAYIISLLIFGLGSILIVLSSFFTDIFPHYSNYSYWFMVFSRFIQAIGGGALIPISIGAASKIVPKLSSPIVFGLIGASAEAGGVIGPLWGGVITHFASWEWVFLINIPFIILTIVLILKYPKVARKKTKIDIFNGTIFALFIAASTLGFSRIGYQDNKMYLFFVISIFLMILMIILHKLEIGNLFPKNFFRFSNFFWANITHFFIGSSLIIVMVTVPLTCATIFSMTALESGLELLKFTISLGLFAVIGGIITKNKKGIISSTGGFLISGTSLWLISLWDFNTTELNRTINLVLAGSGFGLLVSPLTDRAVSGINENVKGIASSLFTTYRMIGMIISLAALTSFGTIQFYDLVLGIPSLSSNHEINTIIAEKSMNATITVFSNFYFSGSIICFVGLIPLFLMYKSKAT